MPTFETFKDLSITFKKHPVSDDLVVVKDKAAIVQAITALLLTNKGERPFQPDLGCDIRKSLFEPLDYATSGLIRSQVLDVLGKYEPRIEVDDIIVSPDEQNNGYDVELYFTIVGRNDEVIATEFFLERTR
ncbi:baseplate wedge subunit [Synechococcus phage ACG-2014e]|jgi:phage baseplate assembly protein W|uniref:Base plate wedge subunit n=1 Tax=Synechococcus phage ACG-2014e TaxID=1493510 RepID=A0A0E3F3H3_9CAUD|nr:baseplate wedge subunit [Synechococcus phage ACG-2014e]YP_010355695.1 baseplate wedge subunit [Synechococcus phage ACG-2014e]AIX20546.1 base plate wedge subunit [Synechococcus phage ACG-2014e]AIX29761.1 base plate wedge subunit [Synechococcus phage ACG-2014e]AIX45000.1 base plate wedge subunit [Synechococcus phage ACG-2014e]